MTIYDRKQINNLIETANPDYKERAKNLEDSLRFAINELYDATEISKRWKYAFFFAAMWGAVATVAIWGMWSR